MNTRILLIAACILAACWCARSLAATEEWSFPGSNGVYQLVTDGKGGCAFVRLEVAGMRMIWLDHKGEVRFQKPIILGAQAILALSKNYLYYLDYSPPGQAVVQVDKKGADARIATDAQSIPQVPALWAVPENSVGDKKGFFVVRIETNTAQYTVSRFSNK